MPRLLLRRLLCLAGLIAACPPLHAQAPANPVIVPGSSLSADPVVASAQSYMGRALILRGFPEGDHLTYDQGGHLQSPGKVTDWTLAGVNLDRVSRKGPAELELEGTRAGVRYNPDSHSFDRKPLKIDAQHDEHIHITLPAATADSVLATMAAIFSAGIDPALERSMPPYWSHYFLPQLPWLNDPMTGQTILPPTGPLAAGIVAPVVAKKVASDYTAEARAERFRGSARFRMVVDAEGLPHHIAVRTPLGYGLDARAAEALAQYRFKPASKDGKPVAVEIFFTEIFDFAVTP